MMNKYKTFEELKEELGDKFEEYMYKSNIELLTKIDKSIEWINKHIDTFEERNITIYDWDSLSNPKDLLEILKGDDKK